MTVDGEADSLAWNGERYLPHIRGNIRLEHLHRYLLARELVRGKAVLDIACGEGYGANLLADAASRVIGVDMAPDVVVHASRRYRRPNLTFRGGSCSAIPLTDASVDVVVSFETIEHHDEHERMVDEVRRVLKPGGLFVVSSPDRREYSDLPNYRNPFHVRELYREDFDLLLRSRFAHVALAGQRIRAGSLVGPLTPDAAVAFLTFREANEDVATTAGLEAPTYLLAFASDAALPAVPVGLMDGGAFTWMEPPAVDLESAAAVAAAATGDTDATPVPLGRLADLERAEVRHVARIAALEAQAARLERAVERHRAQALSSWRHALEDRTRVTEVRREAASSSLRAEDACQEAERLRATVAGLEAAHASTAAAADAERTAWRIEEARLRAALDHLAHAVAARDAETAALRNSRSWRVTRPLRAIRSALADVGGRTWRLAARAARLAYRALPAPHAWKRAVKGSVFAYAPRPIRHTASYRAWYEQERARSAIHAPSPVSSDPVAPCDPATPAENIVCAEAAPLVEGTAYAAPVPVAVESRDYVAQMHGAPVTTAIKAIAFYLPQFHPIPENDAWWGPGFTEWTNVTRGRPRFDGHYQPHLPGELGYYDLRVPAVQRRQVELAKQYGIHGFCYYYYWFDGVRLLDGPLSQVLATPDLDVPFCLCWANENWTRRWDGADADVLMAQQHDADDDEAFIRAVAPILADPRYIRVDGRALLLVYRPSLLPDAAATARRWRAYCRSVGLELFLASTHAFDRRDPRDFGFDAAVEFAPNNIAVPPVSDLSNVDAGFTGTVFDYRALVARSASYEPAPYPCFRSVAPMWDNESRRPGRGTTYAHSTPALYREWLTNACRYTERQLSPDMPFVFINAWNEWSEGAHLEPDQRYGYAYLQATADALAAFPPHRERRERVVVVSHDAHFNGAQVLAVHLTRTLARTFHYDVDVLLCGGGPLTAEFEAVATVHDAGPSVDDGRLADLARRLRSLGAATAFCNTSAVGRVVDVLKREGFVVVSLVHELPGIIASLGLEASVASIARVADHVVFPAEMVRREFLKLADVAPERTVIQPQGLLAPNPLTAARTEARETLRRRLGVDAGMRIVLGAGYADHRKGIDLFVEAGRRLVAATRDVVCVWLGTPEPVAYGAAVATIEPALRARFRFLPSEPDFHVFFAGADLFLMTSREDPFPTVVLHALDAQLPVIGFEGAGGFVELLDRGCGVLVPYLDTDALARAALRLLRAPAECARLAAVGDDLLAREFAFTAYVRSLLDLTRPPRPRVSVVVPNYNYARYLPERLGSIVDQTLPPHEILFLDDCSTDDSVTVAREILRVSGLPYRIIRQEARQGTYRQWLRGLAEADGDLVWLAEADDACAPTFLETLTPAFDRPEVVVAYCQSQQVDETGAELAADYRGYTDAISRTKWLKAHVRPGRDEIQDTLFIKNTIPSASAVLLRRPNLSAIEAELATMRYAGDWLVYVTMLDAGAVAFVPEVLNRHRRHADSAIARGGMALMKEILAVQRHIACRYPIAPDVLRLRDAEFQGAYEHLGLHRTGPLAAADHPELAALAVAGVG